MRIYFYSWRLACFERSRWREFAHTRSRRERNDCKWNSAVFPEFFTLNNASTSGRPHTTANPHGPPAAPTQLFSVFPLAGSRPLIACLRDHIYDAIVHCVPGEDDLHPGVLIFTGCFSSRGRCVPPWPCSKTGRMYFSKHLSLSSGHLLSDGNTIDCIIFLRGRLDCYITFVLRHINPFWGI